MLVMHLTPSTCVQDNKAPEITTLTSAYAQLCSYWYVRPILLSISGYLCAGLVNGLEFEMIYKKFAIEIGRRLDVNYIKFCKMVYN